MAECDEDKKDDLYPYFKDTIMMSEAGHRLGLLEVTVASSMKIYRSFRKHCSPADNHDYQLGAMACLSLSCKIHEQPCRLSLVVTTCHRCMYPDQPVLDISALYWRLKDSVAKYELIVLRVINFELNHELPHKYLLHFILSTTLWTDPRHVSNTQAAFFSWTLLQDSFHTDLNDIHDPVVMATAMLYFAVKCCKVTIHNGVRQWWEVFCPEVTETRLIEISEKMIRFYEKKNPSRFLSEESDSSFEEFKPESSPEEDRYLI